MTFENVSRDISESEVVELLCKAQNRYLVVNEFSINAYYKRLPYLLSPYTQPFQSSKLFDKIYPIYYDDIALVAVYACKMGENGK